MFDLVMNFSGFFLVVHGFIKVFGGEGREGEKIKEEKEEFASRKGLKDAGWLGWKCCFLFPPSLAKPEKMGGWRGGGPFSLSNLPPSKKEGVDIVGDLEDTHI